MPVGLPLHVLEDVAASQAWKKNMGRPCWRPEFMIGPPACLSVLPLLPPGKAMSEALTIHVERSPHHSCVESLIWMAGKPKF